MKTLKFLSPSILFLSFFIFICFSGKQQLKRYYYAYGEKISLISMSNKFIIRYAKEKSQDTVTANLLKYNKNSVLHWHDPRSIVITTTNESEKESMMQTLTKDNDVYSCQTLYTTNTGLEMGVTDEILVNFF